MSYPILIQPLVIEDETDAKVGYETIFGRLAERLPLAPCCYAFCHDEAVRFLDTERIFQLVVLDLRLPQSEGVPAMEGLDLGQDLLARCARRDTYPIPSLLVISGHVDRADQEQLKVSTDSGFAHGRVFVKAGLHMLEAELERAIRAAIAYCSIGVHLRDSGDARYPTITPREDDLLRRVIQSHVGAVGVDLDWWSADSARASSASRLEWTKVLMGRILFDKGDRPSRPNFFKFMAAPRGVPVIETAQRMAQKLSHVKLNGVMSCSNAALIVTEKVGASEERPTPLQVLLQASTRATEDLARVSSQVVAQLETLGNRGAQTKPIREFLWKHHDLRTITKAWSIHGAEALPECSAGVSPPELFVRLSENDEIVRFEEQTFLHGDLHIGNIALDVAPVGVDAYIFDAGGTDPNISVRDVASLEVSALLHQEFDEPAFIDACKRLYLCKALVPAPGATGGEPVADNTYELIRQLRIAIEGKVRRPDLFALMVFDYALIQLGGLTFAGSSKVRDPRCAARLAAFAAAWYDELAALYVRQKPSLCSSGSSAVGFGEIG